MTRMPSEIHACDSGTPTVRNRSKPTTEERFWAKVDRRGPNDCWLWTAARHGHGDGYGYFWSGPGKSGRAHRFSYELLVGPIPEGLVLDHLCRVTHCVNPAHLEPVTNKVNTLRGESFGATNASKTHCDYGHAFDEDNTYITYRGRRSCRACNARNQSAYEARLREAVAS